MFSFPPTVARLSRMTHTAPTEEVTRRIQVFNEVRDIPYHVATNGEPDWCCATKCAVLQRRLASLGLGSRFVFGEYKWSSLGLPAAVMRLLPEDRGYHQLLSVRVPESGAWVELDPSWDSALRKRFPIAEWDGVASTATAVALARRCDAAETDAMLRSGYDPDGVAHYMAAHRPFLEAFNQYLWEVRRSQPLETAKHDIWRDELDLGEFSFRAVRPSDFNQLWQWLNAPHIAPVWDGPKTLLEVVEKYKSKVECPNQKNYIVSRGGAPIGYVGIYRVSELAAADYPDEPASTLGCDQFVGDASLLGKGLGSAFLRIVTDWYLARDGVERFITDPDHMNERAIRAYKRAGFDPLGERSVRSGRVMLLEKRAVRG